MGRKGERAMEKLQGFTDHVMLYVKTLVKWLLAAALIGTVGGAVGSLFHLGVEYATELRTEVPALLYALPLTGVLIVALYRFLRTQGVGTNAVLDAVHQGRELPILLIPAIFLATLLTHLAGGSAGREGAALQIGGDLGEHFGKMLRMDDKDCRLATLCGMSALFSALFGTPLAAVFFALEVVSIGVLYYSGLIPCITSSLVAYAVSLRFGIGPMRFAVAAPETGALTLARAAVLALGCALVSILFCEMLHRTEHLAERLVKNDYLRAFLGGTGVRRLATGRLVRTFRLLVVPLFADEHTMVEHDLALCAGGDERVMRHDDDRGALLVQLAEQVEHDVQYGREQQEPKWCFTIAECTYDAGQQVVEERTRYSDKRYEQIIVSSVKNIFRSLHTSQDICTVYACQNRNDDRHQGCQL